MSTRVPNHTIQRTGASRLAQRQYGSPRRLAPTADGGRYVSVTLRLTFVCILASLAALCGCASAPRSRHIELVLYDSDQKPLATVALSIPRGISTNWCEGEWRGELSPAYVRPKDHLVLASDKLQTGSWRSMRCRLDLSHAPAIWVMLHPERPNDFVELFIPYGQASSPLVWNHVTDAGEAERGTVEVLRP
jgi:hypothetical protein